MGLVQGPVADLPILVSPPALDPATDLDRASVASALEHLGDPGEATLVLGAIEAEAVTGFSDVAESKGLPTHSSCAHCLVLAQLSRALAGVLRAGMPVVAVGVGRARIAPLVREIGRSVAIVVEPVIAGREVEVLARAGVHGRIRIVAVVSAWALAIEVPVAVGVLVDETGLASPGETPIHGGADVSLGAGCPVGDRGALARACQADVRGAGVAVVTIRVGRAGRAIRIGEIDAPVTIVVEPIAATRISGRPLLARSGVRLMGTASEYLVAAIDRARILVVAVGVQVTRAGARFGGTPGADNDQGQDDDPANRTQHQRTPIQVEPVTR